MNFLENEKDIISLSISEDLYSRLCDYTYKNEISTSSYDHGYGVRRLYTLEYCLQYTDKNNKIRFYLKRGGRPPVKNHLTSRFGRLDENIGELAVNTPSFDSMCRNIAVKCPKGVYFVNRFSERRTLPDSDRDRSKNAFKTKVKPSY
ncbi:hypothetical protein [Pseudoalteromonas sp. S3173]|uniref:hypothetical protein n=1 Tax=Pseudoalteromonas sp. S3173 TaxID=579531 RepID=UPI00110D0446|nr:hypothetical protein [Pseudoalteromonas sp. S3173]TMS61771.1 hypothetical protein CWC10_10100 [Pseudoalteromonas sp. S3173]